MQSQKSFCFKRNLSAIILFVFIFFGAQQLNAQVKVIAHKLSKKETFYKLSILYRTEVDSIMKWNNLNSIIVSEGTILKIYDYNNLKLEELVYNQYVYDLEVEKAEKLSKEEYFKEKLQMLDKQKMAIDDSKPEAMQAFFDIAKVKKVYQDSLDIVSKKYNLQIAKLRSEKNEIEEDIANKYPSQYANQGYATSLKIREKEEPVGIVSIPKNNQNNPAEDLNPSKSELEASKQAEKQKMEALKKAERAAFEQQKKWQEEENLKLALIAKELKLEEKQAKKEKKKEAAALAKSKKENKSNANNLEDLAKEQAAQEELEKKIKAETLASQRKDQLKALEKEKEAILAEDNKKQKELEKLEKELAVAEQKESDRIAKEQKQAEDLANKELEGNDVKPAIQEKEAEKELSYEEQKVAQLKKDIAAMEAAKAKAQKTNEQKELEIEQQKLAIEKQQALEKELAKKEADRKLAEAQALLDLEAKKVSDVKKAEQEKIEKDLKKAEQEKIAKEIKDLEDKLAKEKMALANLSESNTSQAKDAAIEVKVPEMNTSQLSNEEKELQAMAEAKRIAQEKKAAEKLAKDGAKEKAQLDKDSLSKYSNTGVVAEEIENDPDVRVFDVVYKSDVDTLSKKYIKQQLKLAKEFELELDSSKINRSVTIDEVVIKESKRTKKYKLGDEVDAVSIEKSRFFLSRAKAEIDKGNYKKAIEYTNKSIELNPNYTEAYMLNGDMMASFGYYDKAYNQYLNATKIDNDIPQLHYNMGNCLVYLGKLDLAILRMGEAISIDPSYILAYSGRSALLIEMKQYQNALEDYDRILAINKYFYPAMKGRGMANLNLGLYKDAIRDFNQLLEFDPEDASIYYNRGMAKMYVSEIYGACMDFLSASEKGFSEADKAIKKYCD